MKSEPPTKLGPLAKILSSYLCRRGDFKQSNFSVEHVGVGLGRLLKRTMQMGQNSEC